MNENRFSANSAQDLDVRSRCRSGGRTHSTRAGATPTRVTSLALRESCSLLRAWPCCSRHGSRRPTRAGDRNDRATRCARNVAACALRTTQLQERFPRHDPSSEQRSGLGRPHRPLARAESIRAKHRHPPSLVLLDALRELDYRSCQGILPAQWATVDPDLERRWRTEPGRIRFPTANHLAQLRRRAEDAIARLRDRTPGRT